MCCNFVHISNFDVTFNTHFSGICILIENVKKNTFLTQDCDYLQFTERLNFIFFTMTQKDFENLSI